MKKENERKQRDYLLPALRVARQNLRYAANEIDAMGIMLAAGGITIQEAIDWLDRLNLTSYVGELSVRLLTAEDEEPVLDEIPNEEAIDATQTRESDPPILQQRETEKGTGRRPASRDASAN